MKKQFSVTNFSGRRESSPANLDYRLNNLQNQQVSKPAEESAYTNKFVLPGESLVQRVGQLEIMY